MAGVTEWLMRKPWSHTIQPHDPDQHTHMPWKVSMCQNSEKMHQETLYSISEALAKRRKGALKATNQHKSEMLRLS